MASLAYLTMSDKSSCDPFVIYNIPQLEILIFILFTIQIDISSRISLLTLEIFSSSRMSDSDVDVAALSSPPRVRRPLPPSTLTVPRSGAPQRISILSEGAPAVTLRSQPEAFRRRSNERHSMHAGALSDFGARRSPKEPTKWTDMFTSKRIKKTIQKRLHGESSVGDRGEWLEMIPLFSGRRPREQRQQHIECLRSFGCEHTHGERAEMSRYADSGEF